MWIRRSTTRRRAERVTLNLTTMIDVTFLLLIYFLVTAVLVPREDELTPMLQVQRQAQAAEADDFEQQIIEVRMIEGRPVYRLGTRILHDRQALADAIDPLPRSEAMFVNVADHVPVGFAVAAVQVARDAGFQQVTYVPDESR